MLPLATLPTPEMVGLLAWWSLVLAAPVVLARRRGRRRKAAHRPRLPLCRGLRETRRRRRAKPISGHPAASGSASLRSVEAVVGPRPDAEAADPGGEHRPDAGASRAATGSVPRRDPATAPMPGWLSAQTLEPLCRYVDFRRRLELAASELEARLKQLPADRWRIEPYPLPGERRNTFVILGETGIFVVSATYAPGHWDDVIAVNQLAGKIQRLLPGYPGPVQPAVCHPFTATRPRIWYRPDERGDWVGAWLIGGDSVIGWLEHFGPEHGLTAGDLACFDALAKPNWLRAAIPTPPSWPPIQRAAAPDSPQ